ncbi:DUF421 domain-containing protein [Ferviditalea candida]|uniref:DUF421 domain-containing protein n=1 Tax=Ferviditalea candida TaxID=3108399 RepID=A0ABU5ZHE7_9BACL|nr:DUF421 domain-containing protein [Paenibacillaceae bacterium T2]
MTYPELMMRVGATFVVLLVVIRLQGKKQIAQFSYFNYINGISIGSLSANVVITNAIPFGKGIVMLILWALMTWLIAFLSLKSVNLRKIFEGVPRYVIKQGEIVEKNLRIENVSIDDLNSMLRQKNNFSVQDVESAILELNGSLSVLSKNRVLPVTRGDLHIEGKQVGVALPLVVDGVIMRDNLTANSISEEWVADQLKRRNVNIEEVLYMELGTEGHVLVELRGK